MKGITHEYRRLWAEQLLQEHQRICWQHRVVLRPPLIEIGDALGYWGKWWPSQRTIVISARLIQQHPWETVLNVFRHEMAHQLVSETHGQSRAHGDLFRSACERLGVPPEYRRASGPLADHQPLPDLTGRDRTKALLEKIRKLLALSESANEHEALLAMRKARELMAQHDLSPTGEPSEYCALVINLGGKKIAGHHRAIASLLIDHFQVEVVLATTFDAVTCTTGKCLDLIGRPGQVKVAEYIFHFLNHRLEALWEGQRKIRPGSGRTGKNSYRLGVLKGFREKLAVTSSPGRADRESAAAGAAAPVPAPRQDRQREQFLNWRYPRLRNTRGRSVTIDQEQYRAGQEDGRRLELRAGLQGSNPAPILPLPGHSGG